jgi:sulfur-carrier protein
MRLVYFARVREAIGLDTEELELPADVQTVADCAKWLADGGANYAAAFSNPSRLRFALDQQMVGEDALIDGATELAIFPPVTGG